MIRHCDKVLARVGLFAIELRLAATGDATDVAIFTVNTRQLAVARLQTPGGMPTYAGDARIDGVLGSAAPIPRLSLR